jgi:hypothetical protein
VSTDTQLRERQAMDEVMHRLITTYSGTHTHEEITRAIGSVYQRFEDAPIRDFVPIFVERLTRRRLDPTDS